MKAQPSSLEARRSWQDGGMIGRRHHVVIDCPDPRALAEFYSELQGHPFCLVARPGWAPPIGSGA